MDKELQVLWSKILDIEK